MATYCLLVRLGELNELDVLLLVQIAYLVPGVQPLYRLVV